MLLVLKRMHHGLGGIESALGRPPGYYLYTLVYGYHRETYLQD